MNSNLKKYRKGFIPVVAIVIAAVLVGAGGTAYYYYSSKRPANMPVPSIIPSAANNQSPSWQEYVNPKYHYKINYPAHWFFHKTGYNPPPPATIRLSNVDENLDPVGNEISIEISSLEDPGENLETNAEIQSLSSQGFSKKSITISDEPAIVLEKENDEGGIDTSIYIYRNGNVYRLSWGLWNSEIRRLNKGTLQQIVDSFKFTQ